MRLVRRTFCPFCRLLNNWWCCGTECTNHWFSNWRSFLWWEMKNCLFGDAPELSPGAVWKSISSKFCNCCWTGTFCPHQPLCKVAGVFVVANCHAGSMEVADFIYQWDWQCFAVWIIMVWHIPECTHFHTILQHDRSFNCGAPVVFDWKLDSMAFSWFSKQQIKSTCWLDCGSVMPTAVTDLLLQLFCDCDKHTSVGPRHFAQLFPMFSLFFPIHSKHSAGFLWLWEMTRSLLAAVLMWKLFQSRENILVNAMLVLQQRKMCFVFSQQWLCLDAKFCSITAIFPWCPMLCWSQLVTGHWIEMNLHSSFSDHCSLQRKPIGHHLFFNFAPLPWSASPRFLPSVSQLKAKPLTKHFLVWLLAAPCKHISAFKHKNDNCIRTVVATWSKHWFTENFGKRVGSSCHGRQQIIATLLSLWTHPSILHF